MTPAERHLKMVLKALDVKWIDEWHRYLLTVKKRRRRHYFFVCYRQVIRLKSIKRPYKTNGQTCLNNSYGIPEPEFIANTLLLLNRKPSLFTSWQLRRSKAWI